MDHVILVDINDNEIGTMEKMEAHRKGLLHRAFSVFIFNSNGELLLQKRNMSKYHSGGLWTNTCCSHPYPGEDPLTAAKRRLMEEMGMQCNLKPAFSFIYKVNLDKGMIEHELDHVFIGTSDNPPTPNTHEVEEFRYIKIDELKKLISDKPEDFTEWFKIVFSQTVDFFHKRKIDSN
ncbi:MAG: isopentenyl-diphosphate Delta-isomerase [Bacteroidota bacterium]|jgi:isopentenyl-diphosphate delta-isomerase